METLDLFVMYTSDRSFHLLEGYRTDNSVLAHGDLIEVPRTFLTDGDQDQSAIILGWGSKYRKIFDLMKRIILSKLDQVSLSSSFIF